MSMSEVEIKELVSDFLSLQDLRGFRYEYLKFVSNEKYQGEIGVVYNVFTPENSLLDGPAVFIVNEQTKEVRFL